MKKIFLIALTVTVLISCSKDDKETFGGFYKGTVYDFQHGKAWTWLEVDKSQKPVRIGIAIDDAAMSSLDQGGEHNGGHNHVNGISMQFHPRIAATPFTHVLLDWNPQGHEPDGIYTLPHFDFHFYMQSEAERLAIPPYDVDSTGFLNFPGPGFMPSTLPNLYVPVPGGAPQMGTHWIDITTPEINGGTFTETFIYGSYNGNVTFYEPMITKEFLDNNPQFSRSFPVPAKYKKSGYYPTRMRIQKDAGVTNVILEGFEYRQGS